MTRSGLRWFALGCMIAALAQLLHLWPLGFDATATLRVGIDSPALPTIVSELGHVPVTKGQGHDGQYYYLIARDPLGLRGYPDLTDDGGYRFRRPLSGWLAGGFGTFRPVVALWALIGVEILGMGLAVSGLAGLSLRLGARRWAVLGVVTSLGLWLSVQLVTPDALALGLALWGAVFVLDRRWTWAVVALSGAALAKDSYLLIAFSLAGWLWFSGRRRPALTVFVIPLTVLTAWAGWLTLTVGGGFSTKGNFGWPVVGLIEALPEWAGSGQVALAIAGLGAVGLGALAVDRTSRCLVRWLLVPWLAVAVAASVAIWGDGNNAVRVMAPLWVFGFVGLATGPTRQARSGAQLQINSRRNLPV